MQGQRALLGLVIGMGVLILAGTAGLIGVVVHRLSAPRQHAVASAAGSGFVPGAALPDTGIATLTEQPGTHVQAVTRLSDTVFCITLSGGGPDRVLVWDVAANRRVSELSLSP